MEADYIGGSNIWRLKAKDFINGALNAVFVAVAPVLLGVIENGGDLLAYDWRLIVKIAVYAFIGYMLKKFMSTPDGKVLGKIG